MNQNNLINIDKIVLRLGILDGVIQKVDLFDLWKRFILLIFLSEDFLPLVSSSKRGLDKVHIGMCIFMV